LRFAEEGKKHEKKIEEVKRGGIALKPRGKIMASRSQITSVK